MSPQRFVSYSLALIVTAGCATNPATGKKEISLVGEGQEVAMGREAAEQVRTQIGLYSDERLDTYVAGIGRRLAAVSERPDLEWSFKVVDDPEVNAFALPGGYIYITRGLLSYANSEAEVAAVLGHEIGHVTARHSVSQMSKAQLATLGLGVGMILKPDLARYGQIGQTGLGLLMLKYGRDDENQADELGMRYLTRAGYSASSMGDVMSMLERVSTGAEGKKGGRVPTWLASHPSPEARLARIQAHQGEYPQGTRDPARADYLRHLDGIVYGPDPREGFVKDDTFYHPGLAFRMEMPKGFRVSNTKQTVAALSPRQDAVVQLALSSRGTPQEAERAFFSQQGIQMGRAWRSTDRGPSAVAREFQAQASSTVIHGLAAFVSHQGKVFELVGYTSASRWPEYDDALARSLGSFGPLTDRRYLDAQPMRMEVLNVPGLLSVDSLARQPRTAVDARELALLNGVTPGTQLKPGQLAKTVVGDEMAMEIRKELARQREGD
jgi:predicted Zn-dependent protease